MNVILNVNIWKHMHVPCMASFWKSFWEDIRENTSSYCKSIELFKLGLSDLLNSYFRTIDVYIEHAHGSHMLVTSLWRHIEQDFLIREVVIQLINQIGQKTANQFKIKCTSGTCCSICTALDNSLPQMSHKIWVILFFYGSEPTKKDWTDVRIGSLMSKEMSQRDTTLLLPRLGFQTRQLKPPI